MHALVPLIFDAAAGRHGWHHNHWWIVFPILVLLLVALVAVLWRRGRGPGKGGGGDSPRRILGERFARGEINAEEYRERLGQLQ